VLLRDLTARVVGRETGAVKFDALTRARRLSKVAGENVVAAGGGRDHAEPAKARVADAHVVKFDFTK
jgi:hypothetical protein